MADLNLGTYSAEDVSIIVKANDEVFTFVGLGEGTFIKLTRAREASSLYQGADNSSCRVFHSNRAGMIEVSLMQSSPINDVLTQIFENDSSTRDSTWLFEILVKDNTGRSYYDGKGCFIANLPESDFAVDATTRTWHLHCMNLEHHLGGNAKVDAGLVQTLTNMGLTLDPKWIA